MAFKIEERKDMNPEFMWDLSKMFKNDEEWKKEYLLLDAEADKIASFSGKLNDALSIKKYLDFQTEFEERLEKLYVYASCRFSEDTRADDAKGLEAGAERLLVKSETLGSFFEPELISKSDDELKKIIESDCLHDYKILLQRIADKKKHTLSAAEERIIASFGEGLSAPGQISAALEDSDMKFESALDGEGNEVEVTGAQFTTLETSTDRVLRKNVFEKYYKGFEEHINTFAQTMSANVKNAVVEANLRNFKSSREMACTAERVPVKVYDNLLSAVHRHLPDMYRYVRLRKRLLGVDELHFYDIYAPLLKDEPKKYSFDDAKELLFDTVKIYGDEYLETVKRGCRENWIDVYPNLGKTGGAYSTGGYLTEPYIMMNFTGNLDSVSTLVHEMGHSMQTYFSNKTQKAPYANYTLFVAEVASTCNENLLVENLLSRTDDPKERLSLLNQYLENFKGTVFRQTMFAEFEKKIHEASQNGTALTPKFLNDTYKELNELYFGPDMVIDDEIKYEWARIPHFYRPFYVFKYATSYSAAVALSEGMRAEAAGKAEGKIKSYLEFLSMGSSLDPLDELKHAGVDFSTPEPIDKALDKFSSVLDEAEKCADLIQNK